MQADRPEERRPSGHEPPRHEAVRQQADGEGRSRSAGDAQARHESAQDLPGPAGVPRGDADADDGGEAGLGDLGALLPQALSRPLRRTHESPKHPQPEGADRERGALRPGGRASPTRGEYPLHPGGLLGLQRLERREHRRRSGHRRVGPEGAVALRESQLHRAGDPRQRRLLKRFKLHVG